jgi:hypothetical protein
MVIEGRNGENIGFVNQTHVASSKMDPGKWFVSQIEIVDEARRFRTKCLFDSTINDRTVA